MASTNNPTTTFGASIIPTQSHTQYAADDALLPPQTLDSPVLTPAASNEDIASEYNASGKPIPIHSPFYTHLPASFERVQTTHSRQTSKANISTSEKDLEAGLTPVTTHAASRNDENNPFTSRVSLEHNKECKMWPSKQTLMLQKTEARRAKHARKFCGGCAAPVRQWWGQFDKRQRLIMKILMAFFVVAAIVGICVGISVAVHGTYYSNSGQQSVQQQHDGKGGSGSS
ncbi:hypothetical protein LTR78_010036 [Recurvomyces mirabilis]|uniref:Uncharacterized protein n=1 Tax=Recurvomyces mirabilis TaxID=574656 RepID=A0AAE0TSS7_9PEZI|nr:hypothetical protein LTR78_010036 [Recurvomyces mirabilis]KAK5149817.1 hypothetical protein LTS14_010638 [Recurvomyces mirabilis]